MLSVSSERVISHLNAVPTRLVALLQGRPTTADLSADLAVVVEVFAGEFFGGGKRRIADLFSGVAHRAR